MANRIITLKWNKISESLGHDLEMKIEKGRHKKLTFKSSRYIFFTTRKLGKGNLTGSALKLLSIRRP